MTQDPVDEDGKPEGTCVTRYLAAELYCCVLKRGWCRHGLSFGHEIFCQHPERKTWCAPAKTVKREEEEKGR